MRHTYTGRHYNTQKIYDMAKARQDSYLKRMDLLTDDLEPVDFDETTTPAADRDVATSSTSQTGSTPESSSTSMAVITKAQYFLPYTTDTFELSRLDIQKQIWSLITCSLAMVQLPTLLPMSLYTVLDIGTGTGFLGYRICTSESIHHRLGFGSRTSAGTCGRHTSNHDISSKQR